MTLAQSQTCFAYSCVGLGGSQWWDRELGWNVQDETTLQTEVLLEAEFEPRVYENSVVSVFYHYWFADVWVANYLAS